MMQFLLSIVLLISSHCISARVFLINGGQDVTPPGKWPFMVSQQIITNDGYHHSCGASLVAEDWLLSAAHCVYSLSTSEITVILGAHDIQTQKLGNPTYREVEEIFVHPNWTNDGATGFQNDIALLKLSTQANATSDFIDIVPMAEESDGDFSGQSCYIIGWGFFDFDDGTGDFPNILQESTMTILSNSKCVDFWGEAMIKPSQVCVVDNKSTPCSSDSGGPLVCQVAGVWTLVGATSWGVCPSPSPAVYARVSSYRSWINEVSEL